MKKDKTSFAELMQGFSSISQLGLSIIVPIILCALLGNYLKNRFNIPDWLFTVIVLVGLLAGINSFVAFIRMYLRRIEKQDQQKK